MTSSLTFSDIVVSSGVPDVSKDRSAFLFTGQDLPEVKDNNKLICFNLTRQYFIYLIRNKFRSSDHHQTIHT